jgi:hypothetical protein
MGMMQTSFVEQGGNFDSVIFWDESSLIPVLQPYFHSVVAEFVLSVPNEKNFVTCLNVLTDENRPTLMIDPSDHEISGCERLTAFPLLTGVLLLSFTGSVRLSSFHHLHGFSMGYSRLASLSGQYGFNCLVNCLTLFGGSDAVSYDLLDYRR